MLQSIGARPPTWGRVQGQGVYFRCGYDMQGRGIHLKGLLASEEAGRGVGLLLGGGRVDKEI